MRLLVLTALVFGGFLFNAFGAVATAAAATITTGDPTCLQFEGQVFGAYVNGNCKGYREGDYVSFRASLTQTGAGTAMGTIDIIWDGPASNCFWTSYFALGHNGESPPAGRPVDPATSGTITATAGAVTTVAGGYKVTVTLTSTASSPQSGFVNFTLQLATTAANNACSSGSSQHVRTTNATGDVSHTGNQTTPIAAGNIIDLPDITVNKQINDDGTVRDPVAGEDITFCLSPAPANGPTCLVANSGNGGTVVFTGVTANSTSTNFTVTETLESGYSFMSGSGTFCTGYTATPTGATVTASVVAQNEAGTVDVQNATCDFVNQVVVLAAEFRSFSAGLSRNAVLLRWRTASEHRLLGFNVYRQVGTRRVRLNRALIPAKSLISSAHGGRAYSFRARAVTRKQRTARYWIQVVNLNGSRSWKGPVRPSAAA